MADPSIQRSEYEVGFDNSVEVYNDVPAAEVRHITADPTSIVTQIRGLWPGLLETRPELVRLYDFNASNFDRFIDFTLGLAYTNSVYKMRSEPSNDFLAKVAEATELRTALLSDLESLAKHKVLKLDPSSAPEITKGYENLISTLSDLSFFFAKNWSVVDGRCALRPEDLVRADKLVNYIQTTVGARARGDKGIEDASDMRDRAYTVVINVYNDIRSGVIYTHRHAGDADEIAPSLFAVQNKRKKVTEEAVQDEAPVPAAVPNTKPQTLAVPPGGPGGNPFLD